VPSAAPRSPGREERDKQVRRERRLARYEAVVELHQRGATLAEIARRVGVSPKTAQRFLRAGTFPERATPRRTPSMIVAYEPYLRERWGAGYRNAMQLWREIRAHGFPGAASLLRRYLAGWRPTPGRRGPTPKGAGVAGGTAPLPQPTRALSPRQARWLLLKPSERLRPAEALHREQLLQADDELGAALALAEDFGRLVRERDREALAPWLERARTSDSAEFRGFALVMGRDLAAVEAALTYEWSNGQTEGQITRLKLLKRQMFGRASFGLLKRRFLYAA